MKTQLTLRQYEQMNGDLTKLNMSKTFTSYGDKNERKPISSLFLTGTNPHGEKLYNVQFTDGTTHRYAESWIVTEVELVLSNKYLKTNL